MSKAREWNLSWSADLAYAVGLMTTDGNLSPDGRHLDFTSKDLEQVETFKHIMCLDNRIGQKESGSAPGQYCWRIQFGSVQVYKWLLDIGLTPNKSKTLGTLTIPDRYFFDFLRGHLDGDGTIRVYNDPAFPNSRRLYIVFNSASPPHLEWIKATVAKLASISGGRILERTRVWELTYAKRDSLTILPKMYYHTDVPCLRRKRTLIEEFLTMNEIDESGECSSENI